MYKNGFKRIVGMLIFQKFSGIFFIGCNIAEIDVLRLIYSADAAHSICEATIPITYINRFEIYICAWENKMWGSIDIQNIDFLGLSMEVQDG